MWKNVSGENLSSNDIFCNFGEPEDLDESLFCEQLHTTNQELWDDLVEEKCYGGPWWVKFFLMLLKQILIPTVESPLPTGYLSFIFYWWTYCNIADRGIELMLQFLHAFFTVLSERIPWMSLFVASFPSSLYLLKKHFGFIKTISRSLWYVQSAIHFTIMTLLLRQFGARRESEEMLICWVP